MHVVEERLNSVRAGTWSPAALAEHNPVVLEAVAELFAGRPEVGVVAADVAGKFAAALGLDIRDAPRIRVTVAARALDDLVAASASRVRHELRRLVTDPLVTMVCDALLGHDDAVPHGPRAVERDVSERALCLVAKMVAAQEEVDSLRSLIDRDGH